MAMRDRNPAIVKRFWNTVTPASIKGASVSSYVAPSVAWAVRLWKRSIPQADKAARPSAIPTIRDAVTSEAAAPQ